MKKIGTIVIIIALTFLLTACGNTDDSESVNENVSVDIVVAGNINNRIIADYIYLPRQIPIQEYSYHIQGAKMHGERIYYWYADFEASIFIESVTYDGANQQSVQIPTTEGFIEIGGLKIADNGNIHIIYSATTNTGESTLIYGIYTEQGVEIASEDLSHIVQPDFGHFRLIDAVFSEQGYIVLSGMTGDVSVEALLICNDMTHIEQLSINLGDRILHLHDDRVVVWSQCDNNYSILREINFESVDFGETFRLSTQNVRNIFCAGYSSEHDLLIFDGVNLIGYELATSTATTLFDWVETNLGVAHELYIGVLPNGQIFVIYSGIDTAGWSSEFFILTRTSRGDIDEEYTVITLGGVWVSNDARRFVTAFNRLNQDYQIEIRCYDTIYGWEVGATRFNLDMITGQGPDIIFGWSIETLEDTEFLAELYSFIDSDPDLSREDFLPNVLTGMENRNGEIQFISNYFAISVFYAMSETVAEVGALTYDNIIRWLSESEARNFGDEWMHRYWFVLESMLSFSEDFIDWENGVTNFDSEEFVDLLNIAYTMPEQDQFGLRSSFEDLLYGNQLLTMEMVFNVNDLRGGSRLDTLIAAGLDGLIPVGVPSTIPGQHEFFVGHSLVFGINAGSSHQEAAWSFVRSILMPDGFVAGYNGLPLRIDVLESLIAESMTPIIIDGEERRQPTGPFGNMIYAMTEEEATALWYVIDNTSLRTRRSETIENIVMEDLQSFFSGSVTAEDTARILQSRISRYLAERN